MNISALLDIPRLPCASQAQAFSSSSQVYLSAIQFEIAYTQAQERNIKNSSDLDIKCGDQQTKWIFGGVIQYDFNLY